MSMDDYKRIDFKRRASYLGDIIEEAHGIEARVFFKGMADALRGADDLSIEQPESWKLKRFYKLGYVAAMQVCAEEGK